MKLGSFDPSATGVISDDQVAAQPLAAQPAGFVRDDEVDAAPATPKGFVADSEVDTPPPAATLPVGAVGQPWANTAGQPNIPAGVSLPPPPAPNPSYWNGQSDNAMPIMNDAALNGQAYQTQHTSPTPQVPEGWSPAAAWNTGMKFGAGLVSSGASALEGGMGLVDRGVAGLRRLSGAIPDAQLYGGVAERDATRHAVMAPLTGLAAKAEKNFPESPGGSQLGGMPLEPMVAHSGPLAVGLAGLAVAPEAAPGILPELAGGGAALGGQAAFIAPQVIGAAGESYNNAIQRKQSPDTAIKEAVFAGATTYAINRLNVNKLTGDGQLAFQGVLAQKIDQAGIRAATMGTQNAILSASSSLAEDAYKAFTEQNPKLMEGAPERAIEAAKTGGLTGVIMSGVHMAAKEGPAAFNEWWQNNYGRGSGPKQTGYTGEMEAADRASLGLPASGTLTDAQYKEALRRLALTQHPDRFANATPEVKAAQANVFMAGKQALDRLMGVAGPAEPVAARPTPAAPPEPTPAPKPTEKPPTAPAAPESTPAAPVATPVAKPAFAIGDRVTDGQLGISGEVTGLRKSAGGIFPVVKFEGAEKERTVDPTRLTIQQAPATPTAAIPMPEATKETPNAISQQGTNARRVRDEGVRGENRPAGVGESNAQPQEVAPAGKAEAEGQTAPIAEPKEEVGPTVQGDRETPSPKPEQVTAPVAPARSDQSPQPGEVTPKASDADILKGLTFEKNGEGTVRVTYTHPEGGVLLRTELKRSFGKLDKDGKVTVTPKLMQEIRDNIGHFEDAKARGKAIEEAVRAPTPPAPAKPPEAKEPHEMTRAEYSQKRAAELLSTKQSVGVGAAKWRANTEHEKSVQDAIDAGKIASHPDYPELGKPESATTPPPAKAEAAAPTPVETPPRWRPDNPANRGTEVEYLSPKSGTIHRAFVVSDGGGDTVIVRNQHGVQTKVDRGELRMPGQWQPEELDAAAKNATGRSVEPSGKQMAAYQQTLKNMRGTSPATPVEPPAKPAGTGTWREEFDKATDPSHKSTILRYKAERPKTTDAEFADILRLSRGLPDEGNIQWAVAQNPKASKETRDNALAIYNSHDAFGSPLESPKPAPVEETPKAAATPASTTAYPPRSLPEYGVNRGEVAKQYGLPEDLYENGTYITDRYRKADARMDAVQKGGLGTQSRKAAQAELDAAWKDVVDRVRAKMTSPPEPVEETPKAEAPVVNENNANVMDKTYAKYKAIADKLASDIYAAKKTAKDGISKSPIDMPEHPAQNRTNKITEAEAYLDHLTQDKLPEFAKEAERFRKLAEPKPDAVPQPAKPSFPQHNGESLSWDAGMYMTSAQASEGYPKAKAVLAAMKEQRPEQFVKEHNQAIRDSMGGIYAHNAKAYLNLIETVDPNLKSAPAAPAAKVETPKAGMELDDNAKALRKQYVKEIGPPADDLVVADKLAAAIAKMDGHNTTEKIRAEHMAEALQYVPKNLSIVSAAQSDLEAHRMAASGRKGQLAPDGGGYVGERARKVWSAAGMDLPKIGDTVAVRKAVEQILGGQFARGINKELLAKFPDEYEKQFAAKETPPAETPVVWKSKPLEPEKIYKTPEVFEPGNDYERVPNPTVTGPERIRRQYDRYRLPNGQLIEKANNWGTEWQLVEEPAAPARAEAFARTTPAKGTLEREALEAERKAGSDSGDALRDQRDKLKDQFDKMKYGTKARDSVEKRLGKLNDQLAELDKATKPTREKVRTAFLEDLVENGDEANRLGALGQLNRGGAHGNYAKIKDLALAEAKRQGMQGDDAKDAAESAASMISSYPGNRPLEKQVEIEARSQQQQRAQSDAIDKLNTMNDLRAAQRKEFIQRIENAKHDPAGVAEVLKQAEKQNEEEASNYMGSKRIAGIADAMEKVASRTGGATEEQISNAQSNVTMEEKNAALKKLKEEGRIKIEGKGKDARAISTPKAEPTAAPAKAEATGKAIEDFGTKLGGARKDRVAPTIEGDLTDQAIAEKPLSEIWPKSEIDAIEDPRMAALATAIRHEIPAKPRKGYKLTNWVDQIKTVKELMRIAGDKGVDAVIEKMKDPKYRLRNVVDKIGLLTQIPREEWDRVGRVENYPDAFRYTDGKKEPMPLAQATVDGRIISAKDIPSLVDAVNTRLAESKPATEMQFEVRGREGAWGINKKGDPLYRKLQTFTDSKEALKYAREHRDELTKAWEDLKERENVRERDLRTEDNLPRSGKDYRNGKDVTPQMFSDAFGFRGVEFGNWVSDGKNAKERQGMLNGAFDALHDMADIIGVPTRALSLNGEMGLRFGSNGSGWASAHYEPGTIAINLTKTRGAGALAHEWFHALDHYFQRQRGESITDNHGNYMTQAPESMYRNEKTGTLLSAKRFGELKGRGQINNPEDWKLATGVRLEVEEAFTNLVRVLDESPMRKRSELIDASKSSKYWGTRIERAARSFENYIIYKMKEGGYRNDYLANVVDEAHFGRDPARYPYLLESEVKPIADAFDKLFSTIKVKESAGTVGGGGKPNLAMYHHDESAFDQGPGYAPGTQHGSSFERGEMGPGAAQGNIIPTRRPGVWNEARSKILALAHGVRERMAGIEQRWGAPVAQAFKVPEFVPRQAAQHIASFMRDAFKANGVPPEAPSEFTAVGLHYRRVNEEATQAKSLAKSLVPDAPQVNDYQAKAMARTKATENSTDADEWRANYEAELAEIKASAEEAKAVTTQKQGEVEDAVHAALQDSVNPQEFSENVATNLAKLTDGKELVEQWKKLENPEVPYGNHSGFLNVGDWVIAKDRENIGKVSAVNGKAFQVTFKNPNSGAVAAKTFPGSDLAQIKTNEDKDSVTKRSDLIYDKIGVFPKLSPEMLTDLEGRPYIQNAIKTWNRDVAPTIDDIRVRNDFPMNQSKTASPFVLNAAAVPEVSTAKTDTSMDRKGSPFVGTQRRAIKTDPRELLTSVLQGHLAYQAHQDLVNQIKKLAVPEDQVLPPATDDGKFSRGVVKGKTVDVRAIAMSEPGGGVDFYHVPLDVADQWDRAGQQDIHSKVLGELGRANDLYVRLKILLDVAPHSVRTLVHAGNEMARQGNIFYSAPGMLGLPATIAKSIAISHGPMGRAYDQLLTRMGADTATGLTGEDATPKTAMGRAWVGLSGGWSHDFIKKVVDPAARRLVLHAYLKTVLGDDRLAKLATLPYADSAKQIESQLGPQRMIEAQRMVNSAIGFANHFNRSPLLNVAQKTALPFAASESGMIPHEISKMLTLGVDVPNTYKQFSRGNVFKALSMLAGGLLSGALGYYLSANAMQYGLTSLRDGKGKWMWDNDGGHKMDVNLGHNWYLSNLDPGLARAARTLFVKDFANERGTKGYDTKAAAVDALGKTPVSAWNEVMSVILPSVQALAALTTGHTLQYNGRGETYKAHPENIIPVPVGQRTIQAIRSGKDVGDAATSDLTAAATGARVTKVTDTKPTSRALDVARESSFHSSQSATPEQQAKWKQEGAIIDALRGGDHGPLRDALRDKTINQADMRAIQEKAKLPELVYRVEHSGMSVGDAMRVYDAGTPDEKAMLSEPIQKKVMNAKISTEDQDRILSEHGVKLSDANQALRNKKATNALLEAGTIRGIMKSYSKEP